jgi:hypothetical protein
LAKRKKKKSTIKKKKRRITAKRLENEQRYQSPIDEAIYRAAHTIMK